MIASRSVFLKISENSSITNIFRFQANIFVFDCSSTAEFVLTQAPNDSCLAAASKMSCRPSELKTVDGRETGTAEFIAFECIQDFPVSKALFQ